MSTQLDLFGEVEEREERRRALLDAPGTCPCCGITEPSGFMLRNNHGIVDGTLYGYPIGDHPNYGGQCIAQSLVTNHIVYAATHECDPGALDRAKARGRELGLDVDQIVREATA